MDSYEYQPTHIFLENTDDEHYSLAVVDMVDEKNFNVVSSRKFVGKINVDKKRPTNFEDKAIFDILAPSIGATDIFIDLFDIYETPSLNYWTPKVTSNPENIFTDIDNCLTLDDRKELYTTRKSITKESIVNFDKFSINFLLESSRADVWKNGVLQECIDRLVKKKFQRKPEVYAIIDENYRKILRFKLELKRPVLNDHMITQTIRTLTSSLGLQHTRDQSYFETIGQVSTKTIDILSEMVGLKDLVSYFDKLDKILEIWSGSRLKHHESGSGYYLVVDDKVGTGVSYLKKDLLMFGQI